MAVIDCVRRFDFWMIPNAQKCSTALMPFDVTLQVSDWSAFKQKPTPECSRNACWKGDSNRILLSPKTIPCVHRRSILIWELSGWGAPSVQSIWHSPLYMQKIGVSESWYFWDQTEQPGETGSQTAWKTLVFDYWYACLKKYIRA